MLKWLNEEKTMLQFGMITCTLSSPEDFSSIGSGPVREAVLKALSAGVQVAAFVPIAPSLEQRRQEAYAKEGVSTEALIVALWEAFVENRPAETNRLQALRTKVKNEIPI